MSAEGLVAVLEQGGILLKVEGTKLKLEAPADKMPSSETLAELRENKAAVIEYLTERSQPIKNQFVSLPEPRLRKTEKQYCALNQPVLVPANESTAPCGSRECAGCYEVKPGVHIHPPKCGVEYRKWLERWVASSKIQ
jgi:hypothetical protein